MKAVLTSAAAFPSWKARKFAEEDEETETAAFWFNTVALTLTETDVSILFERENNYEDDSHALPPPILPLAAVLLPWLPLASPAAASP